MSAEASSGSPRPSVLSKRAEIPGPIESYCLTSGEIDRTLQLMASQIVRDYADRPLPPILVPILDGAMETCVGLMRNLYEQGLNCPRYWIAISSYGDGKVSSGEFKVICSPKMKVVGRDCIIVEDVVETHGTISEARKALRRMGAETIEEASLLGKGDHKIKYLGKRIGKDWVEGFGLDTEGFGRGNPHVVVRPQNY